MSTVSGPTKGTVESGVKYLKRNFLPGRTFVDVVDFQSQLDEWTTTIADRRVHGTTNEEPLARYARERDHLVPLGHSAASSRRPGSRGLSPKII